MRVVTWVLEKWMVHEKLLIIETFFKIILVSFYRNETFLVERYYTYLDVEINCLFTLQIWLKLEVRLKFTMLVTF